MEPCGRIRTPEECPREDIGERAVELQQETRAFLKRVQLMDTNDSSSGGEDQV